MIFLHFWKTFKQFFNNFFYFFQLHLSPDAPYFRITTHGLGGQCRIELPHDSELVDNFQCKAPATFGYKFMHIRPTLKALGCASKVSLRTDEFGLLCFQYMVKSDKGTPCYVEYFVRIFFSVLQLP